MQKKRSNGQSARWARDQKCNHPSKEQPGLEEYCQEQRRIGRQRHAVFARNQ